MLWSVQVQAFGELGVCVVKSQFTKVCVVHESIWDRYQVLSEPRLCNSGQRATIKTPCEPLPTHTCSGEQHQ